MTSAAGDPARPRACRGPVLVPPEETRQLLFHPATEAATTASTTRAGAAGTNGASMDPFFGLPDQDCYPLDAPGLSPPPLFADVSRSPAQTIWAVGFINGCVVVFVCWTDRPLALTRCRSKETLSGHHWWTLAPLFHSSRNSYHLPPRHPRCLVRGRGCRQWCQQQREQDVSNTSHSTHGH